MFCYCEKFNKPLNNWDVSNVTNTSRMFYYCEKFNKPLNNWNVSNVTNTTEMFDYCNILEEYKPSFEEDYKPSYEEKYNPSYEKEIIFKKYMKLSEIDKNENKYCPITYEDFTDEPIIVKTLCDHIFSKEGIDLWISNKESVNCPLCRKKII
jgi:surface protein